MTFSDRARRYAEAVADGSVLACRLVRLACERHLADLGRGEDFPHRFDPEAADRVCRFIELLPHIKGSWANRRERMRLEDWQCFVVCCAFGWRQKADGLRRFRRVYVEVPRKNGKSSLTAALGLYMLGADGEHGAEVYCLSPETRVLCDDFVWRPVGDLAAGAGLIAFDEEPPAGRGQYRKLRHASVVSNERIVQPCIRVTFEDGSTVVASKRHRWLAKRAPAGDRQTWVETAALYPGSRIRYFGEPWGPPIETRAAGYLAGLYDGEGCIGTSPNKVRAGFRVQISQKPGLVMDRIMAGLDAIGIARSRPRPHASGVEHVDVQSAYQCFRLLGLVQPHRLLARAAQLYEGRALNRGQIWNTVVAVEDVGEREVMATETTTGTLLAEGLFSHNSGAGSEKQALEVFGPARLMARATPDLCAELGVQVNASNLSVLETASKFEPIIGKPGDGASPSFSITDEYHEHQTSEQYDTMVTGMGAREQPMAWVITTAGSDTAGPCYALRSEVVDVLQGSVQNDRLFGIVYNAEVDWTSEEALRMANPNYGVSVFADYLKAQQTDAINSPRKQSTFKTKHLNVWTTAASPFFNLELWNRRADAPPIAEFRGAPCWIGLDLAAKRDVAAKVRVFRREIEGAPHFYAYGSFYLPAALAEDPALQHYAEWGKTGHLILTQGRDGDETDYDAIEEDIKADSEAHRIVQLGFDPYNATQLVGHLQDHGILCVDVPQNVRHMSEPMKWVEAMIVSGRIHHDGNPAFAWMISNVTAQVDRNDNVYPRKERLEKKIDGAVALIIAMGRALTPEAPAPTYDLIFLGG